MTDNFKEIGSLFGREGACQSFWNALLFSWIPTGTIR